MKQLFSELLIVDKRYSELKDILISSDTNESYVLEHEYIRGKFDMLLHLISIYNGE
jgi:hypothetical protein